MIRSHQIHLDLTITQTIELQRWLDRCRNLYNALLEQRILAYKQSKAWSKSKAVGSKLTSRYGQMAQLPDLKATCPEFANVNAAVLQDVCGRLDKTFKAFFTRNKTIKTGGFPRFKGYNRYSSFTHPQASVCKFDPFNREFYLPSFGWLRYHNDGRDLPVGKLKTATFKKMPDGWWLNVAIDIANAPTKLLPRTGRAVGLDMGLKALVTTDGGAILGDLAPIKRIERRIRDTQRELSRKTKGSHRRRKCKEKLAKQNLRLARTKDLQLQTISRKLVNENDVIVVEDLDIKGMLANPKTNVPMTPAGKRGMNRNIGLASWGRLVFLLSYKAEDAGRTVVRVDPRGTSQECSSCGDKPAIRKTLKDRIHTCAVCGLVLDRDHNAAKSILKRGLATINHGKHGPVVNSASFVS